jgi:uncharacterized membrane protein YphA (DoxX/SURF4 family)
MYWLVITSQLILGFGLLNVWLLRAGKATPYRSRAAQNMSEEFAEYGLPSWFMWSTGCLKVTLGVALIAGLWFRSVTGPAAALLALGAVIMHWKVQDPLLKFFPAASLLALSLFVAISQ